MQPRMYVVYPAPLFDGWEVVKEGDADEPVFFERREEALAYAHARAAREGGGRVVLEDWFGMPQEEWDVPDPDATSRYAAARRDGRRDAAQDEASPAEAAPASAKPRS